MSNAADYPPTPNEIRERAFELFTRRVNPDSIPPYDEELAVQDWLTAQAQLWSAWDYSNMEVETKAYHDV